MILSVEFVLNSLKNAMEEESSINIPIIANVLLLHPIGMVLHASIVVLVKIGVSLRKNVSFVNKIRYGIKTLKPASDVLKELSLI